MAGGAKDLIAEDVSKLITQITGFTEEDDTRNYDICTTFALSNLLHHRYLSVDNHAIRRSIFGMVTKFMIHGHLQASRRLDSLLHKFLNDSSNNNKDLQWSILSLLLQLSNNPTNNVKEEKLTPTPSSTKDDSRTDSFDWTTYSHLCEVLKKGSEEFNTDFAALTDNEDWDESSNSDSPQPIVEEESSDAVDVPEVTTIDIPLRQHEKVAAIHNRHYAANQWIAKNVQRQWWHGGNFQEVVQSDFPSSSLCTSWDICSGRDPRLTSILSEYKVVREVLWMVQIPTTTCIFQKCNEDFSVRPNLSISSLTKDSVGSYLNKLCQYFRMIYDIQEFLKEVHSPDSLPTSDSEANLPSHTFEAYSVALSEFLREIQELAVDIEKRIKSQDEVYTLISLHIELGPKFKHLSVVYNVHSKATKDWKKTENCMAASRLLSILYNEALSCMECDRPCYLLRLFLRSFRPYMDIIDMWLTEGKLADPRDEFIIFKKTNPDNGLWDDGYVVRPYVEQLDGRGTKSLPLLEVIAAKVLHAGRSMKMLQRLDRLGDTRKEGLKPDAIYIKFLEELEVSIIRAGDVKSFPLENVSSKLMLEPPSHEPSTALEVFVADVADQLQSLNDDFLGKAFTDCIPYKNQRYSLPKKSTDFTRINELYKRLTTISTCGLMPLKTIMEKVLSGIIEGKHQEACYLVKKIFMEEYKLLKHLALVRAIYLMEAGDIMHRFSLFIFKEVENKMLWSNSYTLTLLLEECINYRYPDHSSKFSVAVHSNARLNGTPSIMDEIIVTYAVEWPLSIILSSRHMESYNSIFQFLLKIKWALWCLESLRFSDLDDIGDPKDLVVKKHIRLLQLLRFWLAHAIGSVHTYLMGQVLHSLGLQLERDLENAPDLDSLVQIHDNYVDLIYTRCLQTLSSDVIRTAILQMVRLALKLRKHWLCRLEEVEEGELVRMVEMYIKCHAFLGSVLQNTVDSGEGPYLSGLTVAINTAVPALEIFQ